MRLLTMLLGAALSATIVVSVFSQSDEDGHAAKNRSGKDLLLACQAGQGAATNWCAAYLMGVADTLTAFGQGGHKGGLCGSSYQVDDLSRIFQKWIHENPKFLELDMLAGASLALRNQWPCR
jgi:serine/threonine protein phosphatase PrpC